MPADSPDYTKYVAIVMSLATLGYTIHKDWKLNRRVKKVEQEQEREKIESAKRRSKASAPYFSPSKQLFAHVYESLDKGEIRFWSGMDGNVLSFNRAEIPEDAPETTPVILVLDNSGKGARRIMLSGDILGIELKQEPDVQGSKGLIFLKYPYMPAQRGKIQKVIMSFETEDGFDLIHAYETKHGFSEFFRVDPK